MSDFVQGLIIFYKLWKPFAYSLNCTDLMSSQLPERAVFLLLVPWEILISILSLPRDVHLEWA
jgi:hypothetical protein